MHVGAHSQLLESDFTGGPCAGKMPRGKAGVGGGLRPSRVYVFTTDPSCSCLQLPVEMARCHSYVTSVPSVPPVSAGCLLVRSVLDRGSGVSLSDSVSFHLVKMGAAGGF